MQRPAHGSNKIVVNRAIHDRLTQTVAGVAVIPNVQEITDLPNAEVYHRHDVRTLAIATMSHQSKIVGALGVYTLGEHRTFTADELSLIQGLADQTAQAITNARLLAEARRRINYVQALHSIDIAITGSLDLKVSLDVVVDQTVTQLGVDAASILLFDPFSNTLEYAAGRGFRTIGIQRSRLRLGEGHAGRAAMEHRLVSIPDLSEAGNNFVRAGLLAGEEFVSYFAAPLVVKGQVRGVLEVFHRRRLDPDREWLNFLETLAGQAAIALDNVTLFNDLQLSNSRLIEAYDTTLEGWSRALDLRDKETEGHSQRVTEMAVQMARAMGMNGSEINHARRGALLHDIGKLGVPDAILLKPGPLSEAEWVMMRQHPTYAYELLYPIAYLRPAVDVPYAHHEKWDGTGYPRGLKGEQIPLAARIFAIVDVWDALRSDRPYRAAWPDEKAAQHIQSLSGTHFDPQVEEVFLATEIAYRQTG